MWLQEIRLKVYEVVYKPNLKILVVYQDPRSSLDTRQGLVTTLGITRILDQINKSSVMTCFVHSFFKFPISVDVCEWLVSLTT